MNVWKKTLRKDPDAEKEKRSATAGRKGNRSAGVVDVGFRYVRNVSQRTNGALVMAQPGYVLTVNAFT